MADELPLYEIRPKQGGEGFTLSGPLLPWPLWYDKAADCYSYWKNRVAPVSGARVDIYDEHNRHFRTVELPKGTDGVDTSLGRR